MPRIGDVIATGDCKHCGRLIQQTYWGNGGNEWTHVDGDRHECHRVTNAEPVTRA